MFIFLFHRQFRQFFKRFKVTYVAITKMIVDSWMVIRCDRVDGFFCCFFFCSAAPFFLQVPNQKTGANRKVMKMIKRSFRGRISYMGTKQNPGNSIELLMETKNSSSQRGILVIGVNFSEILIKEEGIQFELAGNSSNPSSSYRDSTVDLHIHVHVPFNPGGGGGLPYKGSIGTCGQPGYVFRDFCLNQGIEFIIFCLNQGIDLSIIGILS